MGSPPPPDPYIALGLPKDASSAAIKGAYRKLVLKFHPDKVSDEAQKRAAADQFHKVQTAYEIVGDEDRRARYDAQCKLAELRKDVMQRQGDGGSRVDVRTAAYKIPTDSPGRWTFNARGPERSQGIYEERRPYDADYFDRPRATARKDYEYERPKRSSPRDDREQARVTRQQAKENERARQKEKNRQADKDTRRERDRKFTYVSEENSDSSGSPVERTSRRMKQDDEQRRAARMYHEQAQAQKEAAARGYFDERARKAFGGDADAKYDDAKSYIERSRGRTHPEFEQRRLSPVRAPSNTKVEYIKRGEGRPAVMIRRGSGRPTGRGRDEEETPRRSSQRDREGERERPRRSSAEIVDEPQRPPPLHQTKSAPEDIRIPYDKQRSHSLQTDSDCKDAFAVPPLKRAETMPHTSSKVDATTRKPTKSSHLRESLRANEMVDGQPTPSANQDWNGAQPHPHKYSYRKQYADDYEYPTPDGYRTEVREPNATGRTITRSPSPIRETHETREKPRAASSRHPIAQPPRPSRTTSYVYTPSGVEAMPSRPSLSREDMAHGKPYLYGELPTTRSPRQHRSKYSPPLEEVRYQPEIRPEQIRVQSGYATSRRPNEGKPSYTRANSFNSPVYAS